MSEPRIPRRRIAYSATGGLLGIAAAAFHNPVTEPNASIVIALIYVFGGIVLGYMGAQIAPEIFQRK